MAFRLFGFVLQAGVLHFSFDCQSFSAGFCRALAWWLFCKTLACGAACAALVSKAFGMLANGKQSPTPRKIYKGE